MSTSTTCKVYWTNLDNVVTEVDSIRSTCDSSLTSCTIYGSNGGSESVKCNSKLQVSSVGTNYKYAGYFCACGANTITVPDIVQCTDKCFTLKNNYRCNVLTLTTGFTTGSPLNGVKSDQCVTYRCDSTGTTCTDDGTLLWKCDNTQQDTQIASSSTKSYVCNCNGAAKIPSLYQSNGQTQGKGCSGGGGSSGSSSSSSTVRTTGTPAVSSTTTAFTMSTTSTANVLSTTTSVVPTTTATGGVHMGQSGADPLVGLLMLILTFFRL